MLRYFKVLIVNGYYEIHMKNILKVMNNFFCKQYGKKKVNYSAPTEKQEVESYNLGNRSAERSSKNIEAKILLEHIHFLFNFEFKTMIFHLQDHRFNMILVSTTIAIINI